MQLSTEKVTSSCYKLLLTRRCLTTSAQHARLPTFPGTMQDAVYIPLSIEITRIQWWNVGNILCSQSYFVSFIYVSRHPRERDKGQEPSIVDSYHILLPAWKHTRTRQNVNIHIYIHSTPDIYTYICCKVSNIWKNMQLLDSPTCIMGNKWHPHNSPVFCFPVHSNHTPHLKLLTE